MAKWLLGVVLLGGLAAVGFLLFSGADDELESGVRQDAPVEPEIGTVPKRIDDDSPSAPGRLPKGPPPAAEVGAEDVLSGTVYDDEGSPLAGASVEVFVYRSRDNPAVGRYRIRFNEESLARATTNARGKFEFKNLSITQSYLTMRVGAPGYASILKDHVGLGMIVDTHLEKGGVVKGVVLDVDSGDPVVGVSVEVEVRDDAATLHSYKRWRRTTTTDGEGRFVFPSVQAGKAAVILDHPDYEREVRGLDDELIVHRGATNNWEFTIKRGLVLDGVVLDDKTGKPIKNAEVILRDFLPFIPSQKEVTGVFGKFRMAGVRRGQLEVLIRARGFSRHSEQMFLGDDETAKPVTFRLKPAGAANGTVIDRDGKPVAGARIYVAHRASIFRQVRDVAETTTGADGRFSVGGLDDGGIYSIAAHSPGYTIGASDEIEAVTDAVVEDVIIELTRGSSIQGRVTDEVGIGVENVTVSIHKPPFGKVWFPPQTGIGQVEVLTFSTDRSGFFSVEGLYPGSYRITPDHPDYIPVPEKPIEVRADDEVLGQDFVIKIGHSIQGRVVDHFGTPAAGARVIATLGRAQGRQVVARADARGQYRLRRLLDRAYRIRAESENGWAEAIEEVPADSTGIDFVLQEMGSIRGRVLTQEASNPVTKFTVRLSPLMDLETSETRPDLTDRYVLKLVRTHEAFREETVVSRDGSFTLERVPPGDYVVEILSEEYRDGERPGVHVLPGAATDLSPFVLASGARFEGFVRDTLGNPITGKDLKIIVAAIPGGVTKTTTDASGNVETSRSSPQWEGRESTPDERGFFSIGGLPPGQVRLSFYSETFCTPEPRVTTFGPSGVTRDDMTLTRAATVTYDIVDTAGEPIVNPTANVLRPDGSMARVDGRRALGRGDVHGKLTVRKLEPGAYQLEIQRWGYERAIVEIEVAEGEKLEGRAVLQTLR